ncbi:MAG TPA: flagellar hook-basal body complex protein FliE [Candidatus Eremiobacteraceae bacterium]|nr:flagellar hook-basal body complex protein FliE [Candidatus Eremiobacteraceae bacterium]
MIAGASAPVQAVITTQVPGDAQSPPSEDAGNGGARFAAALTAMTDGVAGAVDAADRSAATLAAGNGDVAAAAIARAKADVALEIASVAASRVSSAITALLQTQS